MIGCLRAAYRLIWRVRHRAAGANDLHGLAFRLSLSQLLQFAFGKFSDWEILLTNPTSHSVSRLVFLFPVLVQAFR